MSCIANNSSFMYLVHCQYNYTHTYMYWNNVFILFVHALSHHLLLLSPPSSPLLQPADISLRWQVASSTLRGSEGSINIPILFGLNEVPQNMENDSSSNNVTVNIPVGARAAVTVQM